MFEHDVNFMWRRKYIVNKFILEKDIYKKKSILSPFTDIIVQDLLVPLRFFSLVVAAKRLFMNTSFITFHARSMC